MCLTTSGFVLYICILFLLICRTQGSLKCHMWVPDWWRRVLDCLLFFHVLINYPRKIVWLCGCLGLTLFSLPSSLLRIQRDTLHDSIMFIPHNVSLGPNPTTQLKLQNELVLNRSALCPRQIEAEEAILWSRFQQKHAGYCFPQGLSFPI